MTNEQGIEIWYDFDSSSKTASVTYKGRESESYSNEYTGDVVIPSKVMYDGTEYSVTEIGAGAFSECRGLTSVTIPESVTKIGSLAFDGTALYNKESNWNNNVLYIDDCLIVAKNGLLGEYVIKEGTRLIGDWAFSECSGLTSITIPESVTEIGDWVFCGCSGLTSMTISENVTSIGDGTFVDCIGLISVVIPESVKEIGGDAFRGCSGLTSITIPESVTEIGRRAFDECN